MKRVEISPEIQEGVAIGMEQAPKPANDLGGRLDPDSAQYVAAMFHGVNASKEISSIEKRAQDIATIALKDASVALELLGGEDGARQIMGGIATDHLLQMIENQAGNV